MGKGKPKVQKASTLQGGKSAKAQPPITNWQNERPIFCFRHSDRGSEQEWKFKPDGKDATTLIDFLCDMATTTWREIEVMKSGGRLKHHYQRLGSLSKKAQADAERCKLPETFGDEMFRFRLGSERRLWGYRRGRTFHVVWWDPDHAVYPTEPN